MNATQIPIMKQVERVQNQNMSDFYFIFFPSPAFNVVPLLIDGGDRWSILKCAGGSTVLSG